MTSDDQIKDEKLQYDVNREAAKISISLTLDKIDKYGYLTDDEILPPNQKQIIGQAKFTYSSLDKALKNKEKQFTIKEKNKQKQLKNKEKKIKAIEFNKDADNKPHKILDELSYERMSEIKRFKQTNWP